MKRLLLAVGVATAFLLGYASASEAWPGVPDRNANYGYFFNVHDTAGGDVFSGGIPSYVDTANEFVSFIFSKLDTGNSREKIGAAFLIQYMRGAPYSRNVTPTATERADFDTRVHYAENNGWIFWNVGYPYTGNSYWQGSNGGGSEPNDDAFFYETGTRNSITFKNSANQIAVVIKRDCANPLTDGAMPGLDYVWAINGATNIVGSTTPAPGDSVTFSHYAYNYGQTLAPNIWWVPLDGPSSSPTGLASGASNSGDYLGGQTKFYNEPFTVPNNAAAGTKYCRLLGWDPVNSWGGRNGRGAEACVTVTIPAKLKAAMSVSPSAMPPGSTATFTPAISATGNSSPIDVTCSIARTLYPAAGGSSSLGSQPCTTTGGSSTITIGSGASVTLRANTYAAADTLAVGSRICDVITITNPSTAGYYTNYPADQTASSCVVIAKNPYVQFLGGDVWSGGGFASVLPACNNAGKITTVTRANTLSDGSRPGSGVTYGAFAMGKITNFGSGSMALVTSTGVGDNWTFSNIDTSNLGFFGSPQHCIADYAPTYESATTLAGNVTIDVGTQGSGAWHVTGGLTIHGTMPAGSRQVYLVDNDIEIDADLKYPASYANAAAIPSLVVIGKHNLHVWTAANQVDGMFEVRGDGTATGIFRTCWPKVIPATVTTCPTTLTVNGAVSAGALDLHRTAGAEGATPAAQKAPAEVFNLSPEMYITNALNPTGQTNLTTSTVRELPPRF